MTPRHPWIALLGWFPPVYFVGLFVNHDKPWVHHDWLFGVLGGNTPIFWWPTRLYRHLKRLT